MKIYGKRGDVVQKEIIIKENKNYYHIPIKNFHVDNVNEEIIKEKLRYPIRSYKKTNQNDITIEFFISYVTLPINVSYNTVLNFVQEDLNINGVNKNTLIKFLNENGLQVKTKNGFILKVKAKQDKVGNYIVNTLDTELRNGITNRAVNLPNVYPEARICWGSVPTEKIRTLDDMPNLFFIFFESRFNRDLNALNGRVRNIYNKIIEQKTTLQKEDNVNLKELKKDIIRKLENNVCDIKTNYTLILLAQLFNQDFLEMDALLR